MTLKNKERMYIHKNCWPLNIQSYSLLYKKYTTLSVTDKLNSLLQFFPLILWALQWSLDNSWTVNFISCQAFIIEALLLCWWLIWYCLWVLGLDYLSWLTATMYVWYFQCITFVEEFTRVCTCDEKNATSSRAGGNTAPNNNLRPTENTNKDIQVETCSEPQRHFAMIKIEKTGSSTLYTILGRFVREHKLNMISQLRGVHINFRAPRGQGEAIYNILGIKNNWSVELMAGMHVLWFIGRNSFISVHPIWLKRNCMFCDL